MTIRVRDVGPRDEPHLWRLLAAGGGPDSWLRHALRREGARGFLGAWDDDGVLRGATLLRSGALCAARLSTDAAIDALLPVLRTRGAWYSLVGPERPCARLAAGLAAGSTPRVDRAQVFMLVTDVERLGPIAADLRPARPQDLDALVPLVAAYRHEDGLTPEGVDPSDWLREHLSTRITHENVRVIEDGGEIVFTGAFNFRGSEGSGLGGIYTVPAARGRGLASRATAALCRIGLSEGPVVTLHVDARNAPALRCYEKAGLVREGEYRLTFW